MNIFATDVSPVACAKALDDKRVVKMVLETAQMLSTAMHMHNAPRIKICLLKKRIVKP